MDPNTDPNQPTPSAALPQPEIQPEMQPNVQLETQYQPQSQPQPAVNNLVPVEAEKSLTNKIAIIVSIAVLIIGGVGVYSWGDGQANTQKTNSGPLLSSSPVVRNDTQRMNDLSHLTTALHSYMSNNRGLLPDADNASWFTFANNYLMSNNDTFADPSGANYILSLTDSLPTSFSATKPIILVTPGSVCNGDSLETNQGSRKVAFQMRLQSGRVACSNN